LLYGPPGTGKTLLAKAIASSFSCSFLSVKGPELMNMYIGESEKNVREVFRIARQNRPCVVFFDELDSIAGKKESGSSSGSGGVMDRVVSQFLAELDGLQSHTTSPTTGSMGESTLEEQDDPNEEEAMMEDSRKMIFVVGATNRPDLLDPAFLRPGRFDRLIFLDVASSKPEKLALCRAVMRQLPVSKDCHWETVVDQIPDGKWTGADFRAWGVQAGMSAMRRTITQIEQSMETLHHTPPHTNGNTKSHWTGMVETLTPRVFVEEVCEDPSQYLNVEISEKDLCDAAKNVQPSVGDVELKRYRRLQQQFQSSTS
jgi:peroxin-6